MPGDNESLTQNRTQIKMTLNTHKYRYRQEYSMASILIKDTTRKEREQIVAESIGNINGSCDGCMSGLVDMYQDYIDGKKEIRDINREFVARYVSGAEGPSKTGCGYT